jgi:PKD repeat protein
MPPTQQVITEAENGTGISLKNGENFILKLRENPSTGYSWQLDLSEGLRILSDEYIQDPAPEGYTGVPGTHSWMIETAVAQGSQQVNAIYKRPWEDTTGTEDNFTLNVTSISSDTISRLWDFGDGTTSTQQNPMHTYSAAGNYTVTLTVTNKAGQNTKTGEITVKTALQKPTAAFSASTTSGPAPLEVKFTDMSTGAPTAWKWSFGDGTYSTAKNPKHRYTKTGEYTVSLTVKNVVGSNRVKKISYINAVSSLNPVTAYLTSISSEKEPLKMQFIGNFAELHRARN